MNSIESASPELETLSLPQAAAFLHVSPSALRMKVKNGQIPGAKIGKKWVFLKEDLVAHVRSRYPESWQALRVTHREVPICHSSDATKPGGSDSPRQVEKEYADLLGRGISD